MPHKKKGPPNWRAFLYSLKCCRLTLRELEIVFNLESFSVTRMIQAVLIFYIHIVANINPFKTSNVNTIFRRITSPLVMGVDTANGTKIVFGYASSPLIKRQLALSFQDFQIVNFHTGNDSPTAGTV